MLNYYRKRWRTETGVPIFRRKLGDAENLFGQFCGLDWIEAAFVAASKKRFLRGKIFYNKESWEQFKKDMIIRRKFLDREDFYLLLEHEGYCYVLKDVHE